MPEFTELETWKQARKIRNVISGIVKRFPIEEKFRLTDQIPGSSRPIGNNIAKGHRRFHYLDNIKFCIIVRGFLTETPDHMIVSLDENLITADILYGFSYRIRPKP